MGQTVAHFKDRNIAWAGIFGLFEGPWPNLALPCGGSSSTRSVDLFLLVPMTTFATGSRISWRPSSWTRPCFCFCFPFDVGSFTCSVERSSELLSWNGVAVLTMCAVRSLKGCSTWSE